jgi:hypothetical protein
MLCSSCQLRRESQEERMCPGELRAVKRSDEFNRSHFETLTAKLANLNHCKRNSPDDDDRAQDLRKVCERLQIRVHVAFS